MQIIYLTSAELAAKTITASITEQSPLTTLIKPPCHEILWQLQKPQGPSSYGIFLKNTQELELLKQGHNSTSAPFATKDISFVIMALAQYNSLAGPDLALLRANFIDLIIIDLGLIDLGLACPASASTPPDSPLAATSLFAVHKIEEIAFAITRLRQYGFRIALMGISEPPDFVRSAALDIDYLCLNSEGLAQNARLIAGLQGHSAPAQGNAKGAEHIKPMQKGESSLAVKGRDKLLIKDLILAASIGAYQYERKAKQRICFNIIAELAEPIHSCLKSEAVPSSRPSPAIGDEMADIFSYDIIIDGIKKLIYDQHFALVETLAQEIAHFILSYREIQGVKIRIEKLDLEPGGVGVEIERYRVA